MMHFCFSERRRENSDIFGFLCFCLSVEDIMYLFHWSTIKIPLKFNTREMKTSEKGKYRKCAIFNY